MKILKFALSLFLVFCLSFTSMAQDKSCSLECTCTMTISDIDITLQGVISGFDWSLIIADGFNPTVIYEEFDQEGTYCFDHFPPGTVMFIRVSYTGCNEFFKSNGEQIETPIVYQKAIKPEEHDDQDVKLNAAMCAGGDCNILVKLHVDWDCYTKVTPNSTSSFGIDGAMSTQQQIWAGGPGNLCRIGHNMSPGYTTCCNIQPELELLGFHCVVDKENIVVTNPNGGFWDYCNPNNYLVEWSNGVVGCNSGCVCGEQLCVVVTDLNTDCRTYASYTPVKCRDVDIFLDGPPNDNDPYSDESFNILDAEKPDLKLFPIPASDYIHVNLYTPDSDGQLMVFGVSGKLLRTIPLSADNGSFYNQKIDITNFESGVYFVKYSNGDIEATEMFIKN